MNNYWPKVLKVAWIGSVLEGFACLLQVLAYLLMSASSAAASRNDLWISRFGADEFMDMANGSIAISFLAFVALASSSLISARNLFTWNSNATL